MSAPGGGPRDEEVGPEVSEPSRVESADAHRPFPRVLVIAAAVALVVSFSTVSALPQDTVLPPIAATVFWISLLVLVGAPLVWVVRRRKDRIRVDLAANPVQWRRQDLATEGSESVPAAPGDDWGIPVFADGYWYSEDDRGRRRVLGPAGWTQPHWPSRPLTGFEKKLRAVIFGLLGVYFVFGFIPSVATVGPCAFVPCDRFPANTAAFGVSESGASTLLVPGCLGDVRAISVETDPADRDGTVLWSISRSSPEPLPEQLEVGRTPAGFREDRSLTQPLPTDQELRVSVTTADRRFSSYVSAANLSPGQVSGRSGSRGTMSVDAFRSAACAEAAYVAPRPPDIVLFGGLACFATPFVLVWLVVHHAIERRKPPGARLAANASCE